MSADSDGYARLERWAVEQGVILAFGIEGTASYGAGVTDYVRRHGHRVIEVNRPDRRERRLNGKSDALDAENAARAVLSGRATATPKAADGQIEMLRQIKIAKDTAVRARTRAIVTLKTLVVTAPPVPRRTRRPAEDGPHRARSDSAPGRCRAHWPPPSTPCASSPAVGSGSRSRSASTSGS